MVSMEYKDMADNFTVCVFCGSSDGNEAVFSKTAFDVGVNLANAGFNIVYGGGSTGLMGQVADGAISAGADVTGVIPKFLQDVEVGHTGLTRKIVTDDMHTRKRIMYEKADLFLSLPGGIGTFDETIEVLTWLQLNVFSKSLILFNINSYWDSFMEMIESSINTGFYRPRNSNFLSSVDSIQELMLKLKSFDKNQLK